jgi:putative transposase
MNRRKAKAKVARAHRKVRNARADFLHRTSTNLVRGAWCHCALCHQLESDL